MKQVLALVVFFMFLGAAVVSYAGGNINCNGPGNDRCGNSTTNNTTINRGGHGGEGGQGGQGGTGIGVGIGKGGNAVIRGSGNSENTNKNRNRNTLTNTNDLSNRNHNSNFGINKQSQGQSQIGINTQGQSTDNANNSKQKTDVSVAGDVIVYEDDYVPSASSAYAPALQASTGTCLGSVSAGGSTVPFGFSIGGTVKDNDCNVRKDAALLYGFGLKKEAMRRVCAGSDAMRAAIGEEGCTAVGVPKKKEISLFSNDDDNNDD
jgi:hypothetical protein